MKDDLVIAAFRNALTRRRPDAGFIFRSDRGRDTAAGDFAFYSKGLEEYRA